MTVDRREFMLAGAALGAGALLAPAPHALSSDVLAPPAARRSSTGARNIIFLVSDGMSAGTLTLADMAIRARTGRDSWWRTLWSESGARRAMVGTFAADSLVTDSAAGGSAWGIGHKVVNGSVNVLSDGATPEPILITAAKKGFKTGLITTTRITDATPASFAANVPKRTMEYAVAEQLLDRGIDVLLGGGSLFFKPALLARHPQVLVARRAEELTGALDRPGRLLGLFAEGSMPFELDRDESVPSLAAMSAATIARLAKAGDDAGTGFVLQIEGGRVDHAAHSNDAGSLLGEQIAFDEAIGVAMEFARTRDDTLLVVTTDHGNANPGLTLYGKTGNEGFSRAMNAKRSFAWIGQQMTSMGDPQEGADSLPRLVLEATGIELSADDTAWLRRKLVDKGRNAGFSACDATESVLGAVLANYTGIAFLSTNHTCDLVECTAVGPGAERLAPCVENTALYGLMRDAIA